MATHPTSISEEPATYEAWAARMDLGSKPPIQSTGRGQLVMGPWADALSRTDWMTPASASAGMTMVLAVAGIARKGIRVPESSAIESYLVQYPELLPAVEAMSQRTIEAFQDKPQVSVEMIRDRESDDHFIALMVRFREYPEDVMDIFESINRAFDEARAISEGWIFVTTDFQNPR